MAVFQEAEQYAAAWYLEHSESKLTMHNVALAKKLVERVRFIGHEQHLPDSVIERTQIAAIFSQTGYAINFNEPLESSRQVLSQYLNQWGSSEEEVLSIMDCLIPNTPPTTSEAALYQDAWNSLVFGVDYLLYLPLYRSELQFMRSEPIRKSIANGWFLTQMQQVNFYSDFAKAKYQPTLAENIAVLAEKCNKNIAKQQLSEELFGGIGSRDSSREVQTFFRTSFDYHIKLVDISDNKARIMISVNSILVSVLISLLTYNFQRVSSVNPMVIVPILVFLIAAIGSLIFAILSSRPNLSDEKEGKDHLFSFMGFRKYSKAEYQKEMNIMLREGSAILSSLTAALYYLGEIIDKKYRYLTISYNIFMVGFVVSVLMFLIVFFL